MAYKRMNRRNKRRAYRKRSMPFSKRQTNVIKSLALKTTKQIAETKFLNVSVDEATCPIGSSAVITNNLNNSYVYNYMTVGTGRSQRVGHQINPIALKLKGWHKLNGVSNGASAREVALRVVLGYVDNDSLQTLEAGLGSFPLFWNGTASIYTNDYRDIMRSFNWKAFKPVYDKVFKVRPDYENSAGSANEVVPQGKDYAMININHKFGKKAELRYDAVNQDCWQKQNLVMLCFSRLMTDDTTLTTLAHEFCLEGGLYYTDI